MKNERRADKRIRDEMNPDPSSQLYIPPSVIDELGEPFGNSVHQTRSGTVTHIRVVQTGAQRLRRARAGDPEERAPPRRRRQPDRRKRSQDKFTSGVKRIEVIWGETVVYVEPGLVSRCMHWLHDDPHAALRLSERRHRRRVS